MVDVLEGLAELMLATKKACPQDQCVHIVRCFPELLRNKIKCLDLVFLLIKNLIGLLEVVIVSRVLLRKCIAERKGQQKCRDDGDNLFHNA